MAASFSSDRTDWASIGIGRLGGWGLPAIAMIAAVPPDLQAIVWPMALAWMGIACLANARRCGRVHCFFTGPFFLAMAALALVVGLEIVSLGTSQWTWIGSGALAGAVLLHVGSESVWGRYRARG